MLGNPIFIVTFALAILLTYLSIRRNWLPVLPSAVLGTIVASVSIILFSLSAGNIWLQALIVGIVFGPLFTSMDVALAVFFRGKAPTARPRANPTVPALPPDEEFDSRRRP